MSLRNSRVQFYVKNVTDQEVNWPSQFYSDKPKQTKKDPFTMVPALETKKAHDQVKMLLIFFPWTPSFRARNDIHLSCRDSSFGLRTL